MLEDFYSELDLSPSATEEEIHAAYRRKARQHHPDLGGDQKKFKQISDAYQQLLNRRIEAANIHVKKNQGANQTQNSENTSNHYVWPKQDQSNFWPGAGNRIRPEKETFTSGDFKQLLTEKLPLQDQTTYFILVNALDIFLTYLILQTGGYEANPVAAWFIRGWGKYGMIWFKLTIVTFVCVIAQVVALRSIRKASILLNVGTAIIACVVLYSIWLLAS